MHLNNLLSLNNGGTLLKKPVVLVFLVTFIFYITVTSGNFWEADSQAVFYLTKNIVDKGQLKVPCYSEAALYQGNCYAKYGIFSSLVVVPFYIVEKLFRDVLHNNYFFQGFFSSLTNPFITALLLTLFYQYLIKLNFSKKLAIFGVFLYGFCTYLPAYTKTLYSEPLLTLLILSCFFILFFSKLEIKNILLAGFIFGLAFLTKVAAIIFIPCLLIIFLKRKINVKKIVIFLTPILLCVLFFFLYNYFRFANILDTGYRNEELNYPLISGLYLHLLSPGKSLFLYQPILFISFLGFKNFLKKQKLVFTILGLMTLIILVFYSLYAHPAGDLTWGSRYLYPSLPFLVISTLFVYKDTKSKIIKRIFYFLIVLSVVIQFSSIYLSYHRYYSYIFKKNESYSLKDVYNNPIFSPLYGQWKMIFRINYESKDRSAWREAFQEYSEESFHINYKIAPSDLFFTRSRSLLPLLVTFVLIEIYLIWRLMRN